jgi:hypothetical protein
MRNLVYRSGCAYRMDHVFINDSVCSHCGGDIRVGDDFVGQLLPSRSTERLIGELSG